MTLRKAWVQPVADLERTTEILEHLEEQVREDEARSFTVRVAERVQAPRESRDKALAAAYDAGVSVSELVRASKLSRNTVYKIIDKELGS